MDTHNASDEKRRYPAVLSAILVLMLTVLVGAPVPAGGSREEPAEEIRVVGEVVAVERSDDGADALLTIATDAGPEVTVAVPDRMSRRIMPGDRFESEERTFKDSDESLRVLEFTVRRGG